MAQSCYLVGSIPDVPQQTIRVVANAVSEDINIPAGDYYALDAEPSRSAMHQVAVALLSHAQIDEVAVGLDSSGRFQLAALNGGAPRSFTLQWLSGTEIRDLLGSTGTLSPAASTFTLAQSKYVWAPGRPENMPGKGRLGTDGWLVYDTQVAEAGTSEIVATTNNSWRENDFSWEHVANSLVWTTSEASREYWPGFFDVVCRRFRRFKLYRASSDWVYDDGSYGTLVYSDGVNEWQLSGASPTVLGPYKMKPERGVIDWDYKRSQGHEWTDGTSGRNDIRLKVRQVTE